MTPRALSVAWLALLGAVALAAQAGGRGDGRALVLPAPVVVTPVSADGGRITTYAVQVAADGGTPQMLLQTPSGLQAKYAGDDLNQLVITVGDESIGALAKAINDGCAQGLQVAGISVPDQTIGNTAVTVPMFSDGGNPADDVTLVDLFVQNTTQAGTKNLRCAHQAFDSGVAATCGTLGTRITPDSSALFPVRWPDRLSCVCCLNGATSTGCSAATVVRVCVQPVTP